MTGRRFEDRTVTTIGELLDFMDHDQEDVLQGVPDDRRERSPGIWYRGLGSRRLSLVPTLYRDNIPVTDEIHLVNKFKHNAHEFLDDRPQGEWEWMLLARHYGLPSRLLDWTESPLIGLFFAADGYTRDYSDTDGCLWCLSPSDLNQFASSGSLRSDVVPMFLDQYDHASTEGDYLGIYSSREVSGPVSSVARPPLAAISIRTTKRIQAQLGVFTIHHADSRSLDEWSEASCIWRYTCPPEGQGFDPPTAPAFGYYVFIVISGA